MIMDLKGKRIGLVSPGGEIRAFFNAGVFQGLIEENCSITRIAGTSGGIMCALPYFQSSNPQDFDKRVYKMIERELFSGNPLQSMIDFFTPKVFKNRLHPDLSLDVCLDEDFIEKEYLDFNPQSQKRFSQTDLVVALTAIADKKSIESRRFNVSPLFLSQDPAMKKKAAQIIKAGASIFSVSDPVVIEGEGDDTFFLDGFYSDNVPVSQMFEDRKFAKKNEVDVIFLINNSNLQNFKSFIDVLMNFRKNFGGVQRYGLQYKKMLHYIETSIILSGADHEQVALTILINRMIKSRLEESGKKANYGDKICLMEGENKEFTFKPIFLIEPQGEHQDIELLVDGFDSQSVAKQNYELGKASIKELLPKIQKGEIKPF